MTGTAADGTGTIRFLVKSGENWFVSDSTRTAALGTWAVNGYADDWYPYDPSTNLLFNHASPGSAVAGSTLTDIQAWGALVQTDGTATTTDDARPWFALSRFFLEAVYTPPPRGTVVAIK